MVQGLRLHTFNSRDAGSIPLTKTPCTMQCSKKKLTNFKNDTSLAVQWLGSRAPTAAGTGSIPGQGTNSPHAKEAKK